MILVSIVFFHSGIANAQQDDAYCHYVNGICYAKYPVYTPAPITPIVDVNNNPINDQNCTATCITSSMMVNSCSLGGTVSWIQVPGKCSNPESYCATSVPCSNGSPVYPTPTSTPTVTGSTANDASEITSTYTDQISGRVTVQQSQTTPTVTISPTITLTITPSTTPNKPSNYSGWLCTYWHYCPSGQNTNTTSYQGATITIDSNITVTTDSQGRFEKNVPHVDTHTVTLTVPEGYQLVSPTSATQTFSTTGTNWKTKLRDIKFTIQKSEESTIPTCDPNGDDKQDASDMAILENEWFGGLTTKTADCNKDGVVNGLDFQILKDQINGVMLQNVIMNSQ